MHQTSRRGEEEEKFSSYQLSGAEIDAGTAGAVFLAWHCSRGRAACGRVGRGAVLSGEKKCVFDFS